MSRKLYAFTCGMGWSTGDVMAYAVADDGHCLASHLCSHNGFAFGDLDLASVATKPLGDEYDKRHAYRKHLGEDYEVVNLIGSSHEERMADEGYSAAFAANKRMQAEQEAAQKVTP